MANMIEKKVRIDEAIELMEKEIEIREPEGCRSGEPHYICYTDAQVKDLEIFKEVQKTWDYNKLSNFYNLYEQNISLFISK